MLKRTFVHCVYTGKKDYSYRSPFTSVEKVPLVLLKPSSANHN